MRLLKRMILLTLLLCVGLLSKPEVAEAAEISVDTKYGEMKISEDDYDNYFVHGNLEDTLVVFYDGEYQFKGIVGDNGSVTVQSYATGASKVYCPGNNYVPTEYEAGELHDDFVTQFLYDNTTVLMCAGNTVAKTVTVMPDGTEHSFNLPTGEPVTKRQFQEFTSDIKSQLVESGVSYEYYSICLSGSLYVQVNAGGSTYYVDYFDGKVEDVAEISYFESVFESIKTDSGLNVAFIFGSNDIAGDSTTMSPRYGDVDSTTFNVLSGVTSVDVAIEPTVINITVPLNVAATIDVNREDALIHSDIVIQNNTKAPVKISLKSLTSKDLPFTNLIKPDELPQGLSWDLLNAVDSMRYFSLGIKAIDLTNNPWKTKTADYIWTTPSFTMTELGTVDAEAKSDLGLSVYFGRTQTVKNSFKFSAVFVAELE
ncbi:MAG: hypothetical protein IKL53_08350 [Lachnospiraceae bacterium]|nr:hypothetical protein [Lachnospiraceae bacterium]